MQIYHCYAKTPNDVEKFFNKKKQPNERYFSSNINRNFINNTDQTILFNIIKDLIEESLNNNDLLPSVCSLLVDYSSGLSKDHLKEDTFDLIKIRNAFVNGYGDEIRFLFSRSSMFKEVYGDGDGDDLRSLLRGTLYNKRMEWIDFNEDLDFLLWLEDKKCDKIFYHRHIPITPSLIKFLKRDEQKYLALVNKLLYDGFHNYEQFRQLLSCVPRDDIIEVFFNNNFQLNDLQNLWHYDSSLVQLLIGNEKSRLKTLSDYTLLENGEFKNYLKQE